MDLATAAAFDMNGTMLRISTVANHAPWAHTVLSWEVPDILAAVRAPTSAGIRFTIYDGFGQDQLGIWRRPGGGDQVAWFLDADGNNLSLTQFARPQERVYVCGATGVAPEAETPGV